jgi:hypothetical protein
MRGFPIALCAAVCGAMAGFGPSAFGQQYPFLAIPGSPKVVTSLFQDSRGRLWLGGNQPAWFDGTRFFFLADYGLPPALAVDFNEDSSGAIWIAAETGVYRFANGRVEQIAGGAASSVIAATPDIAVASMAPPGRSVLSKGSLYRMQRIGSAWRTEAAMDLDSAGPLTLDPAGMLLYPEPGKGWNEVRLEDVVRWRPGTQLPVIRHPVAHFPTNGHMKALRDRAGCVWFGFENGTYYRCGVNDDLKFDVPYAGALTRANLHEASNGDMVLWGDSVLGVGRPGAFRVAIRANGLPGLLDAIQGTDGTVWLATSQGLYRFASPFRIDYWTVRDGLSEAPWSLTRSGGRVYAGLSKARIVVLSADRMHWDPVTSFETGGSVSSLVGMNDGTLVAGFSAGGAKLLGQDGKMLARTKKRSASMRLARTSDGELWMGGGGLGRLVRKGNVLDFETHPLLTPPGGNLMAIKYEEHTRKLWSCYDGGLVERDEFGVWKEFTTADGLLWNSCWSLAPLPNGDVWYAYRGVKGLTQIKPAAGGHISVRHYGAKDGIGDNDTIDADHRGWLWRDAGTDIDVATEAEAVDGKWLPLDQSDGFPANDMNSGSVFVDNDGSLWWGADNDLAHYTPPADLVAPQFSPQIFLSALSWDGAAPKMAEAVAGLPHGSKAVAHIGSLQFDRRKALRLRYRILPDRSSWQESASLDLPLGALSWGAHTLEVQARVFTGPWSGTVSRHLSVLRPVWLTWPALAGFALAGSAAAGFGLGWRKRRARRTRARLPDLAALRLEALAPEVHDVLGTVLDGRYEAGQILARGGFATVLSGRDLQQGGERCAIKIFRPELKDDEWMAHRFQQEVAALEEIQHPNVVRIYGHGTTPGGAPYLVMEFVDGKTLRDAMQEARIPPAAIASLLRQAGSALDGIHAHAIYHRDLKPENIMLRASAPPGQELVIIDFSIAIVQDPDKSVQGISRAAGSIIYMAPENAVGYADSSTDIHSLNKILIELLTGRRLVELLPHASIDLPSRVREVLAGRVWGLSEASLELMCRAAEFHPSSRPKSASQFADRIAQDLESASRANGPSANPGPSSSDGGPGAASGR